MPRAPGFRVPAAEAEATRRRLREDGLLRDDLRPARDGDHVTFPVRTPRGGDVDNDDAVPAASKAALVRLPDAGEYVEARFEARDIRPHDYTELLTWPAEERADAPRAFDALGDIAIVKVPKAWQGTRREQEIGEAMGAFLEARAVFHDDGVDGTYRARRLRRIAGTGTSETTVRENGITLRVNPGAAYYSPRLGTERAAVRAQIQPGARLLDLFCGVGALLVQAAKAGARVEGIDLNPEAVALCRSNLADAGLVAPVHEGDARAIAPGLEVADHVVMNLPHDAPQFLDVAAQCTKPGGVVHLHDITEDAALPQRMQSHLAALEALGRTATVDATRHVRTYAPGTSHYAFDLRLA